MRKILMPAVLAGLLVSACGDDTTGGNGGGGDSPAGGGGTGGEGAQGLGGMGAGGMGAGGMGAGGMGAGGMGAGGSTAECGDGSVDAGEDCDDGNTAATDGCDGDCAVEAGYECTGEPSVCAPDCGDGVVVEGEEDCDDGNAVAGDGCDLMCAVENGFGCIGAPSLCTSTCGDGLVASDEGCDDSGTTAGDGCGATCDEEQGFSCMGEPSVCATSCGDGAIGGTEECDDGDMMSGDGCDANCDEEVGFDCTMMPSVCVTTCGDGVQGGMEACDDSNTMAGDCCSTTCGVEAGCETEPNNTSMTADDFAMHQVAGLVDGFVDPSGDANFYSITIAVPSSITAETLDGILGSSCAANEVDSRIRIIDGAGMVLSSDDDSGSGFCSLVTSGVLMAGTYFVVVDASTFDPMAQFDYALEITTNAVVCGDGDLDPGEQCDDANLVNGDGCSMTCLSECPGVTETEPNDTFGTADPIPANNIQNCASINPIGDDDFFSFTVVGPSSDVIIETSDAAGTFVGCTAAALDTNMFLLAPDGVTQIANNDDIGGGNACSRITRTGLTAGTYFVRIIDFGDDAAIPAYRVKVQITAQCGNNIVEGAEECDGGGGAPCNADCTRIPVCGDTFVDAPEQCDDGNTAPGDGCSATCLNESNESEPNNTQAEANANTVQLTGNHSIGGSITDVTDELDVFRLTLAAPSVVRIETFTSPNECAVGTTTTIRVRDAAFTQLYQDSTTGIRSCSALVINLPAGTFYVSVEESGTNASIPTYILQTAIQTSTGGETEPNETSATASANLGAGNNVFVVGGHLVNADSDFYAITVPAGASIRAELIEGALETCESLGIDSRLTLFSPALVQLVDDDDEGRGFCSMIDGTGMAPLDVGAHTLAAGTYFLQVRQSTSANMAGGQFDYRLAVTVRVP